MRIYLDMCCFNRPYDDQTQPRIRIETEAKVVIQHKQAASLIASGVGKYDALHVACSIAGGAELFVTTDDRLLNRLQSANDIVAMLPQNALAFLEKWYEN